MPRYTGGGKPPALHTSTASKLRAAYCKAWGQEWPHDDRYLNELWFEVADQTPRMAERRELVQLVMRECDTTILT